MDSVGLAEWVQFFFLGWGLGFTLYVLMQSFFVFVLSGRARYWVAVPAPLMALVLLATIGAYLQQSNMWPMLLILTSPVAILYVLSVGIGWLIYSRTRSRKATDVPSNP